MFSKKKEEPNLTCKERIQLFLSAHWRGFLIVVTPIFWCFVIMPPPTEPWQWCAYTLLIMAVLWVTEALPLAITGFMPLMIFPITGVMSSASAATAYVNDAVIMFLGSLLLAYSVEQSGLHTRLAYAAIRSIGYSHLKLFFAVNFVTMFVSMWITNTAATTMMLPIALALLQVLEKEGILKIYDTNSEGQLESGEISTCYFCGVTYAATAGGCGTLVGTGTNLVFKGLFQTEYPDAPEYLSFPLFSAFAVPYMLAMQISFYLTMSSQFFGLFRPNSQVANAAKITDKAKDAAKDSMDTAWKKLGKITYWEWMVILLFGGAIISFFCRSPQVFPGWADKILEQLEISDTKFIKDSSLAMITAYLMFLLPSNLSILNHFTKKFTDDVPQKPIVSVLSWTKVNANMPYSFMFLLGGGVALSRGANWTGLNEVLGEFFNHFVNWPNYVMLLVVVVVVCFVTNFASNVAVANVFAPIAMTLAKKMNVNPLWYDVAAGFSASQCYMLPVGTPGNLIVKCAVNVPTTKMIRAGTFPTIISVLYTWLFTLFYAPIIWPDVLLLPDWIEAGKTETL